MWRKPVGEGAKRTRTDISGGDDRIRTCEGLLTLNGLANRRLQPLGHISVPISEDQFWSRSTDCQGREVLSALSAADFSVESRNADASRFYEWLASCAPRCCTSGCGLFASDRAVQLLDL